MKRNDLVLVLIPLLALWGTGQVSAETRREGSEDALRKAQYIIRQLNQEKSGLQKQLTELQMKVDALEKEQNVAENSLAKSRHNNQRLAERMQSDAEKYKTLLGLYREKVNTLRQANADNQYLVRAVEEREQWIEECHERNQGLFTANSDLLARYKRAATRFDEPITGIGTVSVENEAQEYRFRLEDLQVTRFRPEAEVAPHIRKPLEATHGSSMDPSIN